LHYQNFEIPNTLFGRDGDLIFHVIWLWKVKYGMWLLHICRLSFETDIPMLSEKFRGWGWGIQSVSLSKLVSSKIFNQKLMLLIIKCFVRLGLVDQCLSRSFWKVQSHLDVFILKNPFWKFLHKKFTSAEIDFNWTYTLLGTKVAKSSFLEVQVSRP
jgi:hypothetical protein